MFMVSALRRVANCLCGATQAKKEEKFERFQKLYPRLQLMICDAYLTNADRANCLGVNKVGSPFQKVVRNTPAYKAFEKLLPLINGSRQEVQIENSVEGRRFGQGERLNGQHVNRFSCWHYDPYSQRLITGEYNEKISAGRVRIWDAQSSKQLQCVTSYHDRKMSLGAPISVHLDTQHGRALFASGGPRGLLRVFALDGDSAKPVCKKALWEATCVSANFAANSVICGDDIGRLAMLDEKGEKNSFSYPHGVKFTWLCDAPQIDRVFSACNFYDGLRGRPTLKIWDRSQRTCLFTQEVSMRSDCHGL